MKHLLSNLLFAQAGLALLALAWLGGGSHTVYLFGAPDPGSVFTPSFRFDALSSSMLALVALLGGALVRFSNTYLKAEARRPAFVRQMALAILWVQAFVVSNHLALHGLFWVAMSVSIHRLLRHYPSRARARLSAKKKFLFSRLGDVCFLGAVAILGSTFGTLDVSTLTDLANDATPDQSNALAFACWGLVGAAALKSAQVPFHAWLPETMDAPTPVSALMHAGVVNAGAYLLLRLTPLLEHASGALTALLFVGALTVCVGLLVGSVQPTIKLSLAWSTIAQMGFLFMELGLGLAAAAYIHLVGHAAYKAHAFLRSGTVHLPEEPGASLATRLPTAIASAALFLAAVVLTAQLTGSRLNEQWLWLAALWGMASAPLAAGVGGPWSKATLWLSGLATFAAVGVAEQALGSWFTPLPTMSARGPGVVALGLACLAASAAVSFGAGSWIAPGASERARALYVHALNGLYVGPVTDRWTQAIWPDAPPPRRDQVHPRTRWSAVSRFGMRSSP